MTTDPRRRSRSAGSQDRRGLLLYRLRDFGLPAAEAEQWCQAWEARANAEGRHPRSPDYWAGAAMWILTQLDAHIGR